jgi:arylsulfatase A-like enzyme
MLLAGGGTKRGAVVGATDELGARVVDTPIHVHDLQATILHLLGVDHERLTHKFQGRQFRLTDVHGVVRRELLA